MTPLKSVFFPLEESELLFIKMEGVFWFESISILEFDDEFIDACADVAVVVVLVAILLAIVIVVKSILR